MLNLSPTPWTVAVGILAILATGWLSYHAWKRSAHPKRTLGLEGLRGAIVCLAVVLLWKPEWKTIIHSNSKPKIAVLWDDSKSMQTVDAALPVPFSTKAEVVSRQDWVKKVLEADFWSKLDNGGKNEVVISPFATPATDPTALHGTDLESPLTSLLEKEGNLKAVVMMSDGDVNLGHPPVTAAQKLRKRGVPLYGVAVGSPVRLADLDIISASAPTYGIVGENIHIPFTVRSSLDRQVRTVVRLRDQHGKEVSKELVLPAKSETHDSILWRIGKEGSSTLELSIPVVEGEMVASNNQRKFVVSGKPEKIKVLVIESLPRWEYRFLRNALSRDPGVELSCLLFQPELGMGGGKDYLKEFPNKLEDLAKYDVIFIGDVGVEPNQLTKEQCQLIRGLVENQASGVVFMPGRRGYQFSLLDTALSDLMPVVMDESQKNGWSEGLATPLNLTTDGRGSLLTLLGNNEQENADLWKRLPGFYWSAPVLKAKGGTEVLAVHGNRRGKFGQIPLLVTKPAGSGKVLFMGIDSAWRWRKGVEDLYHYRFWGQVARWMSYQRNMAAGQRVRMFFTPENPEPGATVSLQANAFDGNGAPLQKGRVMVDITSPDGQTQRLDLQKNESEWGAYSGRFKVTSPGAWKMKATVEGGEEKPLETSLIAQGVDLEKVSQPARPEVIEEMAQVSKGRVLQAGQLADLVTEINALPEPKPMEIRVQLWCHWAVVSSLILLMSIFWIARKMNGAF